MTRPKRPSARRVAHTTKVAELAVECFMLAEAAQVVDGKLYVLGGGVTRVLAPSFPFIYFVTLPTLLRIPWNFSEVQHTVSISGVDERGEAVLPANETLIPGGQRPPEAVEGDDLKLIASIGIGPAVFPREGQYRFTLMIDGLEVAATRARVLQMPEASSSSVPVSP